MFWLWTVRGDGGPHLTLLPAMWLDGRLHFCTGPGQQKARNLERDPRCVLITASDRFLTGLDVVVEGSAARVTDESLLQRLAELWLSKLDWPYELVDGAFRDRSSEVAGAEFDSQGVAHVFAVAPSKVLAFGKGEPFSQTLPLRVTGAMAGTDRRHRRDDGALPGAGPKASRSSCSMAGWPRQRCRGQPPCPCSLVATGSYTEVQLAGSLGDRKRSLTTQGAC